MRTATHSGPAAPPRDNPHAQGVHASPVVGRQGPGAVAPALKCGRWCAPSPREWRSLRGWPSYCCSPSAKVPQVECAGDDDPEDEEYLYEDHEPAPMTGKLNSQKNQHPQREGHTQGEPLRLRYSLHSWYQLPVRSRSWPLSLPLSRAAVTAPRAGAPTSAAGAPAGRRPSAASRQRHW